MNTYTTPLLSVNQAIYDEEDGSFQSLIEDIGNVPPQSQCVLAFPPKTYGFNEIVDSINGAVHAGLVAPNASLWLWVKGQFANGEVSALPWDVASHLSSNGWKIRNEIIWACKVGDPAPENRLKRSYDKLFYLTRRDDYFYDRTMGGHNMRLELPRNKRGKVSTRSGVIGSKYISQIESSPFLSENEKLAALQALSGAVEKMQLGEISDFRLFLRGVHKLTRSVVDRVEKEGFFLRITKAHSLPLDDLWVNFSAETNAFISNRMLTMMLRLSCPQNGIVLDLFPSKRTADLVSSLEIRYLTCGSEDEVKLSYAPNIFEMEEQKGEKNC